MFVVTLLSPDAHDFVVVALTLVICALAFIPVDRIMASRPPAATSPGLRREDEGRPRPQGVRPRGFQEQATGASAQARAEEAERQRVAARIKAEADQRLRFHSGWENLVPCVPCLLHRPCAPMAMPRLVQPLAAVLPPARLQ